MKTEVLEKSGKRVVLLGNEAIARGALEAGVGAATSYPGTPTSEVPMVLSQFAKKLGFYFEYSTNEKVALETAAGAAWSGVRAFVSMKHFGANVAADSLMPIAYTGTRAGLVIMVGDDPEGFSSVQSEQDSRYYGIMARLPILEPSDPQECLDLTKLAFKISEQFKIPVILRTTTKVSHSIGPVKLGRLTKTKTKGIFKKEEKIFYSFKPCLRELHVRLEEKIKRLERNYGEKINQFLPGNGEIGIIGSGVSIQYAKEAANELGLKPPMLQLILTHPLSESLISSFIKHRQAVLVLEELEPIVEDFVKKIACRVNPHLQIFGKELLPRTGEYNSETVVPAVSKVFERKHPLDFNKHTKKVQKAIAGLPPRKSVFCPGCPHRSTFYAVKKIYPAAVYAGDIGCYMMGVFDPYKMQDFIISMGAGTSIAHGISRVSKQAVVAFIGDSTFFHAGLPALLNHRFNDDNSPLVVVLDNGITAMTGHQPHPGTGITGMGEKIEPVKIEEVAKALGAEVRVANAFSQKELQEKLKELKEVKGPKVLVARGECRLLTKRKMRRKGLSLPKFELINDKELKKSKILDQFACPAIEKDKINSLCLGCGVCAQICPEGIRVKAESRSKK